MDNDKQNNKVLAGRRVGGKLIWFRTLHRYRLLCLLCAGALALGCPTRSQQNTRPPTLDPTYGLPLPNNRNVAKPAPDASWIWTGRTADNQTIFLRGTVELPAAPKKAVLYVTVDDFFTLYVNGQEADRSVPDPNNGFVWRNVHRVDVAHYLQPGKNVIALRAVNAGGAAGALARLEVNGRPALLTGADWKVSDAGDLPAAWTTVNYDAAGWQPAHVVAPLTGSPWGDAGGIEGWPNYSADVPYLAHITLSPAAVLDLHNGAGKIEADNKLPGALTVHLAPQNSADPPGLVVDFGKEVAGRVIVGGSDQLTAIIGTGESREEAVKAPWGGLHRLDLESGQVAYTPYSAFRYAHITFVSTSGQIDRDVTIHISLDHKYYPVQYKGSFACSDPLLTRIWYTGAYTAHLCMQEDIWDAPKRDRARWMGDLHVSGEVINTVFADRFLMEQTMQRLREEAQGGQPASAEPRGHVNGIPGYSCAWICGLADFHRHLGDYDYLRKQHDLLVSMLAYLREDLDEHGLFANRHKAWPFVDWSPDFNGDSPRARAATHFFLIKAAKEASFLFGEMGDASEAARCRSWADELTRTAQANLLQPDSQTFSDRRQDNAMAIYAGAATSAQVKAIYERVLRPDSPAWQQVATPYYNNYVIYAMSLAGHTNDVLDVLRRYWGGMLAEGATSWWEGYDPSWEKTDFHAHLQADNGTGYFVSLCHGWSSGPTSWLTERVLGVRPTGGGYKTVEITPELGDLQWAEGNVPTPNGSLHIRISKETGGEKLDFILPPHITAQVRLPGHVQLYGAKVASEEYNATEHLTTLRLDRAGRYALVVSDQ